MHEGIILLGTFSRLELDGVIREASRISAAGERIDFISRLFLGLPYAGSTLKGDRNTAEVFVINLAGVDCLTFIEYVEAMRLSGYYSDFAGNLKRVRYRSGIVDFMNRNHFLTDWNQSNAEFVDDVTGEVGGQKTLSIRKTLNEKDDGTYFIEGVPTVEREILYIPGEAVDGPVCARLRNGDYVGIYSGVKGLDVSHAGIAIRDEDRLILRHASSQKEYMRVVDQDFGAYVANKPGIIVLRPKEIQIG